MKPDWDKLVEEFSTHETTTVADVDCTTEGKALCEKAGVRGYPSIKYGDPNSLEDYNGGRDFAELQKFAKALKPSCSPAKLELCDDDTVAKIVELQALGDDDLSDKIREGEKGLAKAEKKFKKRVDKLQEKYKEFEAEKEAEMTEIKNSGLGLMKSVLAHAQKTKGEL